LQEAIKDKSDLEAQVKQLQEEAAVNNAKVAKLEEELSGYKSATVKMSKLAVENKDLTTKVSTLEEELNAKAKTIDSQKNRISKLVAEKKEGLKEGLKSGEETKSLNESLAQKDAEIKLLNENFDSIKADYEAQIQALNESIESMKSDSESKDKEFNDKLDKESRLKESYKKLANKAVTHYIESKATMLGVKASEIMDKLPDDYKIEDIDSICEDLQSYELNMNKLPFSVDRKVKVRVNKSVNESLPTEEEDNDVDDSLYRLAKLK
jgi:chromosome segregation ATPase